MKKINKTYFYILAGFLCIILYYLPYFILGQNASFRITDFLDDEIIQYLYNGKYLFASSDTIVEEWLSGAPLATIQAPCFTLILFFKFLPFFEAVMASCIFGTVFAFLGMFLLCDKILKGEKKYVTLMTSVLFCILPYYPPYGLSSVGIPLVIWACIRMFEIVQEDKSVKFGKLFVKCLPYILVCIFYALSSSLIWAGYFVVGFMVLAGIIMLCKKKKTGWFLLITSMFMTLTYCFVFRETLISVLFETFVSHRSDPDKIYSASDFLTSFIDMFKYGQYHAPSLHTYIMAFSLLMVVAGLIFYKKMDKTTKHRIMLATTVWASLLFIALFHGFYVCEIGLEVRKYLGPLESFQLNRIYWLNPTLWYLELALSVMILFAIVEFLANWLLKFINSKKENITEKTKKVLMQVFRVGFVVAFGLFFANYIIHHICSVEYYTNVQRVFGKETGHWTYHEFYDHELFDEIETYIGMDQSEYRIGCVGFVPAIAQANGFYTVDAYSTNYPLDYKYKFRTVIEKELDKSATLTSYYDHWGSRCYIFSAELETKFQTGKDENIVLENFEINTEALKDLGCDYIFSAVKIGNAEEIHLTLLDVFTTESSKIEIYVYEL
ncbi:MAG: hypothetical protein J6A73_05870 [Lachnospiraceae bacterium]|nr:hypothetical protein [Lachnospiraceae bacterium]